MQMIKSASLVPCVVLLVAASSQAQTRTTTPTPRGYITVSAGATLDPQTAGAFAVEYGDYIGGSAQGYATLSYFDNVIASEAVDDLADLESVLGGLTGTPWNFRGRDRGVSFVAGGKFLVPTGSGIRPYVGGGAGVINIKRTITESTRGDLTSAVIRDLGYTDGAFNTADSSVTKPVAEFLAGVAVEAGPTYIDVGYRYRKAFHLATPLGFGQFSAGIGYRF